MKKQIVYIFINLKTGLVSSLAFACSEEDSKQSDQQLLERFDPSNLVSSLKIKFDYIIVKGNTFCNWHIANTQTTNFYWPATRTRFHTAL